MAARPEDSQGIYGKVTSFDPASSAYRRCWSEHLEDTMQHIIYECGICSCFHPWKWNGDCRDDANRYGTPEDYLETKGIREFDADGNLQLEVRSMDDRIEADCQ